MQASEAETEWYECLGGQSFCPWLVPGQGTSGMGQGGLCRRRVGLVGCLLALAGSGTPFWRAALVVSVVLVTPLLLLALWLAEDEGHRLVSNLVNHRTVLRPTPAIEMR